MAKEKVESIPGRKPEDTYRAGRKRAMNDGKQPEAPSFFRRVIRPLFRWLEGIVGVLLVMVAFALRHNWKELQSGLLFLPFRRCCLLSWWDFIDHCSRRISKA